MKFVPVDAVETSVSMRALITHRGVDTSGGLCGVADFVGGGQGFVARDDDGKLLAVFVLKKIRREHGQELEIRAAFQFSSRGDLTETVLPEIERAFAHDCDVMTIYTRRAGLVRKLEKSGYHEAAKIMQKRVEK